MRAVETVWGAIVEAWQEVRVHRGRVLLSLIGVGVAVCALTSVVGLANIAQQSITESNDRYGGRPALIAVRPMSDPSLPAAGGPVTLDEAWATAAERHAIRYWSRVGGGSVSVQFRTGVADVSLQTVDPDYATMHRTMVQRGRWFTNDDTQRLAPALVVNEDFWHRLGSPALAAHPVATIRSGEGTVTAVVIGVIRTPDNPDYPMAYGLVEGTDALIAPGTSMGNGVEAWVPPELADPLTAALRSELGAALGANTVDVSRTDYLAYQTEDPLAALKLVVMGIAVLILLLGALGLVNIALVTVRNRIREIGVRRSFGATGGRVFFAVMMESVVATVVAGAAGVGLAILIVKSPWVEQLVGRGMVADPPPFPVEAAVIGLVAATAVGALAGLIPALVAVRVKVIDAIRY
ncbi:ABC transporter permease [Leifsonia sp. ZF2019]|uniref:ABC transporter permease n=1 Tax=Leifsonia sp. ZF2019 TaxID=2781978 RepID=UPI001CC00A4C|nr:ABC transporter permease [Leifsonia sp. ZF2019]UAJ78169.1 ABC transporter permease [Leifsonia sp. ZF2019]